MLPRVLVLALVAAFVAGGYVDVYVEDGPEVEGLHIYAWGGAEWRPVYVIYQPQHVDTHVVATGDWVSMPYYNMSRYVLRMPREVVAPRGPPALPPGFERWTLEVDNGTKKITITLAVGREPLKLNNFTIATWQTFGDKEIKTPNKGRLKTPPGRQPKNGAQGGEAGAASYAVSTGATIYPVGSLYFGAVAVAGTFFTYIPVDSPMNHRRICLLDDMHWVGFEVQNFTVGVEVGGYVTGGYLTLEFYNLDTCSFITSVSLPLPSSGRYWTNVQPSLPDAQIGVRVRVSGRAETASIRAYIAARYKKAVQDLAQTATSKAVSEQTLLISVSGRVKVAVFFGPYVAYDGAAATSAGVIYGYVYVPPSTTRLTWYGSYCPTLAVEYYVNGLYYTYRFVSPSTPSPVNYYCNYNVPSTALQIKAREYATSKATSRGGGIAVAVVYTTMGASTTISYGGRLEIVYDRWKEPFRSQYIDSGRGLPYAEWGSTLLSNTLQVLGPVNGTTTNIVTEVRAATNEIILSLQHNNPALCGAGWRFTGLQVGGYTLYYGNEVVEEPWWAAIGRRVADAVDWLMSVTRDRSPWWASILLTIIQNIFATASGLVKIYTDSSATIIEWNRGWTTSTPPAVVIRILRTGGTDVRWDSFAVMYYSISECYRGVGYSVNTNMRLPPTVTGGASASERIWTWRGQISGLNTDLLVKP